LLLSFEGGEASGKSAQARRLAEWLAARGEDVVSLREPGSTPVGERVREILLHAKEIPLAANTQALLFSAARAQLVRDVITPALAAGRVVILDRYFDSTLAYQGAGHGVDQSGLEAVTRFAVGDVRPSRTILLDVPVEVSATRARTRRTDRDWDRFEADEQAFHQRVREGYLRLAAAEPGRFRVIRGDRDEETVAADIRRDIEPLLGTLRAP